MTAARWAASQVAEVEFGSERLRDVAACTRGEPGGTAYLPTEAPQCVGIPRPEVADERRPVADVGRHLVDDCHFSAGSVAHEDDARPGVSARVVGQRSGEGRVMWPR